MALWEERFGTFQLPEADCLLVVPPFAHLTWPSLGVHVLQALGREAGYEVRVLYVNLLYAVLVGRLEYGRLCNAPGDWLLGERIFREAAFGLPPIGADDDTFLGDAKGSGLAHPLSDSSPPSRYLDQLSDVTGETWQGSGVRFSRAELLRYSELAVVMADELALEIAAKKYKMVGLACTFEQIAPVAALVWRLKKARPEMMLTVGGANCEGPMALGMSSVMPDVDCICSGESENSFVELLHRSAVGDDVPPVLEGKPCQDLDSLPPPDFADFFGAIDDWLPEMHDVPLWLSYETSRGCWWGERGRCAFCGLNGLGIGFRAKSPDKIVSDLRAMLAQSPTHRVCMTDNIMPHSFHKSLMPRLASEIPELHLFYEQKSNLTLPQVKGLLDAGNTVIQPGIESLSSSLLQRMNKGVLARQNIALLRYARCVGMGVKWNLLYGLPNDEEQEYRQILELLPKLCHLCPPNALTHLSLDRFSPYFDAPEAHGLGDVSPWPVYKAIFPESTDFANLAYHFHASYPSGSREAKELMDALYKEIVSWREQWAGDTPPALWLSPLGSQYALIDSRNNKSGYFVLDERQATAVLLGGPLNKIPMARWAMNNEFAVELDGWSVPLATCHGELLSAFE
ncbi:MAG: RiPP maturation radical SAM protein 1, partial [Proteobacteria bacterium]|nr:RiPP maturation radical SAM protein 1 [Pseudomonadota bacterium]